MIRAWVGVDPGINGGIFVINEANQMKAWKMPTLGDGIDAKAICNIFKGISRAHETSVIIEQVHSIFGSSAKSNFTFGFVCGVIEAIVVAQGLKFSKVQPKAWQSEIWITSEIEYKPLEAGKVKKSINTKLTSEKAAKRLFPRFDFRGTVKSKKNHDGIIDSALLAEYGRRKNI